MPKIADEAIAAAKSAEAHWGIPASITLAQYGLESSFGLHMPKGSNNPFGMKAVAGQPSVVVPTREYIGGKFVIVRAAFRVFASLAEAFSEHGRLLAQAKPYAKAREKLPDPFAFADALTGVYATDPKYGEKLKTLIRAYNLTQYDRAPKAAPIVAIKPAHAIAAGTAAPALAVVVLAATQAPHIPATIILGAVALTLSLVAVAGVAYLLWRLKTMSAATDNLAAQVTALEAASAAAISEINALKAGTDDAAVNDAANRIQAVVSNLTAAVPAPAAPAA